MFQLRPLPRTLEAALRDVRDAKLSVRLSALKDLARLARDGERQQAIAGLCERLGEDDSADVRADAALALADCEARSALDHLLRASEDAHGRVRQMAVLALGELAPRGHKEALLAVERALASSEGALRFQGLLAANKLDAMGFLDTLTRAVGDADGRVRYLALRLVDERLGETGQAWPELPDALQRACLEAVQDPVADVRVAASFLLAPTGNERAREILTQGLNQLVRLPAPEDEQELIELAGELLLRGAEPGLVRHAWGLFGLVPGRFAFQAKVALARLGHERASREILRGLMSRDRDTRTLAVVAAGRARLSEARPRLEQLSRDDGVDAGVLRAALREIG